MGENKKAEWDVLLPNGLTTHVEFSYRYIPDEQIEEIKGKITDQILQSVAEIMRRYENTRL